MVEGFHHCGHFQIEGFGHTGGEVMIHIGQQTDHPFTHCGGIHLGQFEPERVDDVVLLRRALASVEQRGLAEMVHELLALGAHLHVFHGLGKGGGTAVLHGRLEGTATAE